MATLSVNKTAAGLTKPMFTAGETVIELVAPPALPPPRPRSCCKRVATLRGSVARAVAGAMPPMRSKKLLVPKARAVQMIANKRQQIANKRQQLQTVPPVPKELFLQHPPVSKATLTALSSGAAKGSKESYWAKKSKVPNKPASIVQKQPQSQPAPATECGQILSVARSFQLSVARLYSLMN